MRQSGEITKFGSAFATACEISISTFALSGSAFSLPFIKESKFTDKTKIDELDDEGGDLHYIASTRTVKFEPTFMQKGKTSLELMPTTMRGKYYSVLKELSKATVNGKYIYVFIPVCMPTPDLDLAAPSGNIVASFNCQALTAETAFDLTTMDDGNFTTNMTCTGLTLAKGTYYTILEM
jgi:hypothetical protein